MRALLLAMWAYRHFIVSSVVNDLRARFARSKLGAAWMVLQPLAMVAIYALVLSKVLGAKLPGIDNEYAYAVYLIAGILFWTLFSDIVLRCLTVFVDNGNLLKKIMFPRVCLPVIAVGSSLVNSILLLAASLAIFWMLGHTPDRVLLWMPVLILLTCMLATGLGLLLGTVNVFVRDVGQVTQVVLQLWFWLTPIVYMTSILPDGFGRVVRANPLYPLVDAYQRVLVFGEAPDLIPLGWMALASLGLMAGALLLFRRASPEMADVL